MIGLIKHLNLVPSLRTTSDRDNGDVLFHRRIRMRIHSELGREANMRDRARLISDDDRNALRAYFILSLVAVDEGEILY
jgi:hypothetical protein